MPSPDQGSLSGLATPYSLPGDRPLKLWLDTTSKCNLRCVMCHFAYPEAQRNAMVQWTPELVTRLEREVLPHTQHAHLSFGTEPLLWKHFPALLDACKRTGVPIVDMYTDGALMTEAMARRIVAMLRDAKEQLGAVYPRMQFNITLLRRCAAEIAGALRFAHELGVEYLDLRHVIVHDDLGMEEGSWVHDKPGFNVWMRRVRALEQELGLENVVAPPDFDGPVDSVEIPFLLQVTASHGAIEIPPVYF